MARPSRRRSMAATPRGPPATWATGSSGTASTGRRPRWRWSAPAPCRSSWGRPWCSVAALSTRRAASAPPRDSPWTTWTSARAWPTPVAVTSAGLAWSGFRSIARRWIAYSRPGIPRGGFAAPAAALGALFYGAPLAAVVALALGAPGAAGLFASAPLAVPAALQALRRRQGAAPVPLRLWWALPAALLLLPLLFLDGRRAHAGRAAAGGEASGYVAERRGRRYALEEAGRLARAPAAEPVAIRRRRAGPGERWRRDGGSTWPTAAPRGSRRSTG